MAEQQTAPVKKVTKKKVVAKATQIEETNSPFSEISVEKKDGIVIFTDAMEVHNGVVLRTIVQQTDRSKDAVVSTTLIPGTKLCSSNGKCEVVAG